MLQGRKKDRGRRGSWRFKWRWAQEVGKAIGGSENREEKRGRQHWKGLGRDGKNEGRVLRCVRADPT